MRARAVTATILILALLTLAGAGSVQAQAACNSGTYTYTFTSFCPFPIWIGQSAAPDDVGDRLSWQCRGKELRTPTP
jgi:hypothetical protein